jgi:DNA polymerase-1
MSSSSGEKKQKLVLIDGHSLLFRAFYAIPFLTAPTGEQVNAVYGFASTLLSVIEELEPTHIMVTFDSKGPTKREESFAAYKAQRKPAPEELLAQIEPTHEVVRALNMPIFEMQGYEADDLIGTAAIQARSKGVGVVIVTGDKDMFQLIDDGRIQVYIPGRAGTGSRVYEEQQVVEKLGVRKDQVVDYKGLAGDSSDNIPGIKGIGPKTAVNLLSKYGSLEGIYEAVDKGKLEGVGAAVVKKLNEGREVAFLSRTLATIDTAVPVKLDLEACLVHGYDKQKTLAIFEKFGFKSLVDRLPDDEEEKRVQEALF